MTDLRSIPPHLLAKAAALPSNAHAQAALRRALEAQGHRDTPGAVEGSQGATEDAGGVLTVVLPLPPKELSPNARVHWAKKARAVREARHAAYVAAAIVLDGRLYPGTYPVVPRWERATVQATFYFRDRRRRDPDNLLSSLKAGIDGLADAGIVANDSGLTHLPVIQALDRERPRVELAVHPS